MIKIKEIKPNPNNPRLIKDDKFKKLCDSIQAFPKMMELRPIIIDESNVILGGNMRFNALKHLGYKEIPAEWVKQASELTEEQKQEFIVKDNVGFGEWDWDLLANEWDAEKLEEWGLDLPLGIDINEKELFDIELPFYTPKEKMPDLFELANTEKTNNLILKIEKTDIQNDLKEILKIRAAFFTDFNFNKIADYYYYSNENVKELFEELGMVIIAPKEALKMGFVTLTDNLQEI